MSCLSSSLIFIVTWKFFFFCSFSPCLCLDALLHCETVTQTSQSEHVIVSEMMQTAWRLQRGTSAIFTSGFYFFFVQNKSPIWSMFKLWSWLCCKVNSCSGSQLLFLQWVERIITSIDGGIIRLLLKGLFSLYLRLFVGWNCALCGSQFMCINNLFGSLNHFFHHFQMTRLVIM